MKTINNNGVILIDPDEEPKIIAALMENMNAFLSIKSVEFITTLDKTTQYRERKRGCFPKLHSLTHHGRRKVYRINDLKEYLDDPLNYKS